MVVISVNVLSLYESGYYCGNSMCVNRKLVVVSVGKNFPLFINHL